MAVSFTITRKTSLFHDIDGDNVQDAGELAFIDLDGDGIKDAGEVDYDQDETGVFDPADTLYTRITITNTGDQTATGVTIEDLFTGSSLVAGTLNISPIAFNDSFTAIGNTVLRVGTASTINGGESTFFSGNLLTNDVGDLAGGAGVGPITADQIQGFKIDVITNGVSTNGGKFNIFSDGTFNYVNDGTDAVLTTDSFTYKIRDKGLDGQYDTYDDLTSTGTVTITFALQGAAGSPAHRVWYVDSGAAPGGDGTSANPFQTMASLNGVDLDSTGEYIYVENGAGAVSGPITLEAGQSLIGTGAALNVGGFALASAASNSTLTAASGTIVTLSTGNTIAGINIGNNSGTAGGITGASFGTLTVNNSAIDVVGQALNLTTGTVSGSGFTSTSSDGGVQNVLAIGVNGTLALGTGTLAGATANSVSVSGGNLVLTYAGDVINLAGTGALVRVAGGHSGSLTFTGALTANNGTGLQFDNADGTYNFNGTTILAGGDAGVDILNGSSGTFNFGVAGSTTTTITSPTGIAFRVDTSDAAITYNGNITQANASALLDVTAHAGSKTITFQNGTLSATNGTGLQFIDGDGTYNFNGTTTLNGGDAGIDIVSGSGGTYNFNSNTSINNPTGTAFAVGSGTATIDYNGSIAKTGLSDGLVISVASHTGGTISFDGQVTASGSGDGVSLTNNQGATINFTGGLSLNTSGSSNSAGFVATGSGGAGSGGTVSITGSANTINSGSGTALNVSNTNIGSGGLDFQSIASNGAANGIVLNNTGSTAGLTVTGTGSAGSGGTINSSTGVGILLTSTNHVVLDRMIVQNGGEDGIRATTVNNFTLNNSSVLNNGNADEEHGLDLLNVTGTLLVDNVMVRGSFEHNFKLNNTSGTLDVLNIKNSTFDHLAIQSGAAGGNGVLVVTGGTAVITDASISNSVFRNNFGNGILVNVENNSRIGDNNALGTSTNGFVVYDNDFDDNNIAIQFGVFHAADLTVDINLNTIINDGRRANTAVGGTSTAIVVGSSAIAEAGSTLNARIDTNVIGDANLDGSGSSVGSGIRVIVQGLTDGTILVNNNTIRETPLGYGIDAQFLGHQNDLTPVPTTDITITNNNIDHGNAGFKPGTSEFVLPAIWVAGDNQGGVGGAPPVRAQVSGNTVPSSIAGYTFVGAAMGGWIEVYEYVASGPNGAGDISLVDTGAASANADAELQSANGNNPHTNANAPVALIAGPLTLPPDLSPLPMMAAAPPPAPPTESEPPVDDGAGDDPQVEDGPAPTPAPVPAPAPAGSVVVDDGVLSQAEIDFMVEAAIQRWAAAGASDEQIAAMRAVKVSVSDMGGLLLGESGLGTIVIDSDAAGWRWFVDPTPGDDSEYTGSGTRLAAADTLGLAGTRIDLLTVLTHELGHQIGLSDLAAPGATDELMYGTIGAGERRLPGSDDLSGAADGPVTGAFAFAPITIGSVPAQQTVIVEFRHTIDNPLEDRLVGFWDGISVVDSNETVAVASNTQSGNVDGLTLTGLIYNDIDKNGLFDGADTVVGNVSLTLYADTNNSGAYEAGVDLYVGYTEINGMPGYQQGGDAPAAPGTGTPLTVTTNGSGIYTFSSLAPGDYIVRVNASNFEMAGALLGKISHGTPADPNAGFVDNDNNGEQFLVGQPATYAASRAIRLDYGLENVAGPTGTALDTNNTLDLGFDANAAPVAKPDAVATPENAIGTGSLLADNGSGPDTDPDGPPMSISAVSFGSVGVPFEFASGLIVTVNSDGSYSINPNGKFTKLTDNTSGAVNISASETFTYTLTGGNTVSVTATVQGVAGPGDELHGDSGDNTINGTPNPDLFILHQGGNDTANGMESNDLFIFRAALTSLDKVNGGDGRDQIAIQGDYTGVNALTLGTEVVNVESFVPIPGNNTNFGDPGTNSYSYHVTTVNENVAAGQVMTFDGAQLRVGENFTFRGAAELDGGFRVVGGLGIDDFVGGSQTDVFLFNNGAFGLSDIVNGGAGTARDQLALRGDYFVVFGAGQLVSIESLALLSGHDIPQNTDYDYTIGMNDNNLLGGSMTIDAAQLRADESLVFFGQNETDGFFRISGGAGDDQFLGGQLGDRIRGNGGNDNIFGRGGADELTGGAGNDRFAYDLTTQSTAAATDKITDFTTGDVIAVEGIDANSSTVNDDAFTFIGSAAFTMGTPGQLRAYEVSGEPGHWFVEADVNGDAQADLVIEVYTTDLQPLDAADFVL